MSALDYVERATLLACVGVAAEVVFTALHEPSDRRRLIGYSYAWMLPIYTMLYPGFSFLIPRVGGWAWPLRAPLYAALIMAGELVSGLLLRATVGEAPWEKNYRGKRWCVMGLVRLDYFPAWVAVSLVFERAFRLIAG